MDDVITTYPDVPLDPLKTETRVLHLQPGRFNDDLRGRLQHNNLDVKSEYEALSYTWGTVSSDSAIEVNNGIHLRLTENLSRALRRLRHRRRWRVLWIDAICINQANAAERGHQVVLMGRIYSGATAVCVWLGETGRTERSWKSLCLWLRTKHLFPSMSLVGRAGLVGKEWHRIYRQVLGVCARPYHQMIGTALQHSAPMWHTRAWVMQELLLAKRLVWCFGPAEELCTAPEIWETLWLAVETGAKDVDTGPVNVPSFAGYVNTATQTSPKHDPLWKFAHAARDTDATEVRDKVYSLLGIAKTSVARRIVPDYTAPVSAVFARATFASIFDEGNFEILCFAGGTTVQFNRTLPTWAMDFDKPPFRHLSHALPHSHSPNPQYLDCLLPAEAQLHDDCRRLSVNAMLFDDLSCVMHELLQRSQPRKVIREETKYLADDCRSAQGLLANTTRYGRIVQCPNSWEYRTGVSSPPLLDFLNANIQEVSQWQATDAASSAFQLLIHALVDWSMVENHSQGNDEQRFPELEWSRAANEDTELDFDTLNITRFICTCSFYGIVAGEARPSDVVALVQGARWPVLLRPCRDGAFEFVGFAYVFSMMDVDFAVYLRDSGVVTEDTQRIVLC